MELRGAVPAILGWLFVYRPDLERYFRDLDRHQAALTAKREKPNRGRPKNTGGYREDDLLLVKRMHLLIQNRQVESRWQAAKIVAPEAKGSPEPEARERRLLGRYNEEYPDR